MSRYTTTLSKTLANAHRTQTASVRTQPAASDGFGGAQPRGPVSGWTQRLSAACAVAPAGQTPRTRELAERLGVETLWQVRFAAGTDIRSGDGLIVDGVVYHVIATEQGTHDASLIALCRRQEGDI